MAVSARTGLSARLLEAVPGTHVARVSATEPGLIAGLGRVEAALAQFPPAAWRLLARDGDAVEAGTPLVEISGSASDLAVAEDYVLGPIGFASGIATRAAQFVRTAPPGLRLACGGWKKLPAALKPLLRDGLAVAGVLPRIVDGDFLYVGKNSVRLLGGVEPAIAAGRALCCGPVSIQVRDEAEALAAVRAGAGIVMVDTGRVEDLARVQAALVGAGVRDAITLAFAGGVRLQDLPAVRAAGADTADIGRAILDAPILDLRFEVLN
ncbi:MAG: nicotinate-nucleotide diphosphorylase [Gammaproteobacteria bacterium]